LVEAPDATVKPSSSRPGGRAGREAQRWKTSHQQGATVGEEWKRRRRTSRSDQRKRPKSKEDASALMYDTGLAKGVVASEKGAFA